MPELLLNMIAPAGPYFLDDSNEIIAGYFQKVVYDHLIYAYMIENTKIYEIFRKVLYEYLHGERLEVPSAESQRWLRTTEELFYRDTPPFFAFQLTSYVRPDLRASRRNAYYRMFGMDLTHGTDDNRPYPYEKPAAANRDFVNALEDFLREVWRGIINFNNTSAQNTTDDSAIANQAERLSDMLTVRRRNGNLSREEFFCVAAMSWFHLTVEFDSPIVVDLKAEAASASDRLRKIGERVGLAPHVRAHDFFSLADPMSRLLIAVESETFNEPGNMLPLYAKHSPLRTDISEITNGWSSATGRNIKAEPVTASPARALPPTASPVPATTNSTAPRPRVQVLTWAWIHRGRSQGASAGFGFGAPLERSRRGGGELRFGPPRGPPFRTGEAGERVATLAGIGLDASSAACPFSLLASVGSSGRRARRCRHLPG